MGGKYLQDASVCRNWVSSGNRTTQVMQTLLELFRQQ